MSIATKDLYALAEVPPLGQVPATMHAMTIRQERFGQPKDAFQPEVVPVPEIGPREALVYVMAAGINYNNVWAALGSPVDVIKPYHDLAAAGALADRYFQPLVGASASNDMVFARAQYVFTDNEVAPDAIGHECGFIAKTRTYPDSTIGDLLSAHRSSWSTTVIGTSSRPPINTLSR